MAADPRLDRIAAAFEDALWRADPRVRGHFARVSEAFVTDQLALFRGDPAELGAVLLNLYSDASAMRTAMTAEEVVTGLTFILGHAGTGLYLRRLPIAGTAHP
ncbi:MAG: hypothetical protein HOV87_31245 [Catenulispora sp.]|nr:hypothetical protein [Catenulispora sp.]